MIKTWQQRCEEHPDHQQGIVTQQMIQDRMQEEIDALRQALAQPEQKGHCTCGDPETLGVVHFRTRPCIHYTEPLAQPEQEPVAWQDPQYKTLIEPHKAHPDWIPLYTAPPNLEAAVLEEREACLREIDIELEEWKWSNNATIALSNVYSAIQTRSEK